jgi:hypothetical protein
MYNAHLQSREITWRHEMIAWRHELEFGWLIVSTFSNYTRCLGDLQVIHLGEIAGFDATFYLDTPQPPFSRG